VTVVEEFAFLTADPDQGVSAASERVVLEEIDGYSIRDQLDDNISYQGSVTLSVPIFNNWRTRSNMQRAAIQRQIAELNAQQVRTDLRQIIESAYNDALAASKQYSASLERTNALEETFRVTEERYNLGALNAVDYQVARNNLFAARSDLVRAKYDYIFRLKVIEFYKGNTITL